MDNEGLQFHLTEYACLRAELQTAQKTTYSVAFGTVAANAFIVTWIVTQTGSAPNLGTLFIIAAWLPAIITGIAWFIIIDRAASVRRLSNYCLIVEEKLSFPELGWEKYSRSVRKENRIKIRRIFSVIFMLLMLMSLFFGLYMTFRVM